MSKIVSIGTALPAYCHKQTDILSFMQQVYALPPADARKLRFMYNQSGIAQRYSVLPDYGKPMAEWKFYPPTENLEPFPSLEQRMAVYNKQAPLLSIDAIRDCLSHKHLPQNITHLITVSCTGMSAPGLDLQIMELMDLPKTIFRTSVNFMGCYAATHALKIADALCRNDKGAQVLIVCTELCTLHFQREATMDNMMSSLLFADGAAAVLLMNDEAKAEGLFLDAFYSEIIRKGKRDMAWELSSTGFLMTLSGYVPELIEEDFAVIVQRALSTNNAVKDDVSHWCVHPGGKKILEAIHKTLSFKNGELAASYEVLNEVGNLSSASILFVLKKILQQKTAVKKLFGAAFGPGLTVETFMAHA
ncbi:type III polyketide synthase [Flavisolibacter ginsenosidimutans]|uniref:Type III polyketide synthase n=1 Tax=Flavisolibacter ginsenosidimutans TaxID=661481 RepID=A0A5B8UK51_9BACT|nr:type III polyketide synthase [Flavisolibacter ginsenosidimutans]QEC56395.1 type III polyketide synthase [Flavisolibacter ginsenosidimutans]